MRTRIKVTDLTPGQWSQLQGQLQDEYAIPENAVRVCVTFEGGHMLERHVEMPVRVFVGLMTGLQRVQRHAEAALTPDALPEHGREVAYVGEPRAKVDLSGGQATEEYRELFGQMNTAPPTCEHGATVTGETPSAFEGAEPVRTYADGCQSFGPYRSLDT